MANDEFRTPQQAARDAGLAARHETRVERAIRRQVAEEIAQALEKCVTGNDGALFQGADSAFTGAARLAREVGSKEATPPAPKCARCRDQRIVPDWTNWDDYHGEPKPKPCPDCSGGIS